MITLNNTTTLGLPKAVSKHMSTQELIFFYKNVRDEFDDEAVRQFFDHPERFGAGFLTGAFKWQFTPKGQGHQYWLDVHTRVAKGIVKASEGTTEETEPDVLVAH